MKDIPTSTVVRDTQFIDKKLPVSNLLQLNTNDLINQMSKRDSSESFDLGDEFNMDRRNMPSSNNNEFADDFIEYQYNKPRYSEKESMTIVDHDFDQNQVENEDTNGSKTSLSCGRKRLDLSSLKKNNSKELRIENDSDSDDDWKQIDTQLNCGDIYNIKGEKVDFFVHSQDELTKENSTKTVEKQKVRKSHLQKVAKSGADVGKKIAKITTGVKLGENEEERKLREKYQQAHLVSNDNAKLRYTRIDEEEQAKKFGEMDKKFDFLFHNENSNLRKLHNASASSGLADISTKTVEDFVNNDDFDVIFSNEGHDENELNPSMQMMSTKSMLADSQKIAYVALVKLIIVQLQTDLIEVRGSGSTKVLKKLSVCHTSFTRWSMTVMDALYDHLDIKNEAEIKMIETLSCHGVETGDLSKTFTSNVVIENHLKDEKNEPDLQIINVDKTELEQDNKIEIDVKWTLICDLFLILLESSVYDARSRTLLLHFANAIGITNLEIFQFERRITDSLEIDEAFEILNNNQTLNGVEILKEHKRREKNAKIVKIALATAAGGLIIGLSAGALAPVIGAGLAAGLTTIGISGTGGFLAGAGGTAIITTSGVMSGMHAGKNAMKHRVGSVKTFEFIPLHNNRRVNLIITVSGWMSGTLDDVRLPFSTVDQVMGDLYSLLWEPEMLTSMGQTINILANEILTQSIQQILGSTLLITLMSGLQLPMMLSKLGYLLDNPWNNSLDRAWRSGKVLADTLRRNKLGVRPITLVGFSLGARLIYSCLLSLAKSGDFGIVENVYIFGPPIVIQEDEMAQARSVVSGRFVNGYMKQDWILGYLFRATSGGLRSIAGLSPINEEKYNVENYNCSEYVKGHMQYREATPKLLKMVGWEVLDDQFVEIEQPNPEEEERRRKLISDFEKAQHQKKKKTWYNKIFGKKNKEWWENFDENEKEDSNKKSADDTDKEKTDSDDNDREPEDPRKEVDFNLDALKKEVANIEKEAKRLEKKKSKKHSSGKTNTAINSNAQEFDDENTKNSTEMCIATEGCSKQEEKPLTETQASHSASPDLGKDVHKTNFNLTSDVSPKLPQDIKFEPKKIKKRPSLAQIAETQSKEKAKSSSLQQDHKLKQFRITSHGSGISSGAIGSDHRSPPLNLNLFQSTSKGHVVSNNDAVELQQQKTLDDQQQKLDDLKNIDYGEYEVPKEEHMQICFDDDIDAIEKQIREQQKERPGFGPMTGIDYGDEEEFPHDESNIQFSFE